MSGRSPRPDLGRTDYRLKINDDLRMLHETTLFVYRLVVDTLYTDWYNWCRKRF